MLPIRRLDVFEMVRFCQVKGLEVFGEDDKRVADEQVGKVGRQPIIHASIKELLFNIRVYDEIRV